MFRKFLLPIFLIALMQSSNASDIIFKSRVASVLNTVTLYPDSNYFGNSDIYLSEGELLEIIEETALEHEDDSQNQKFKWYKVRCQDGKTGWVFGDGVAVVLKANKISEPLKSFHKKRIELNNGFEKAVLWVASVEGRDNLHDNDFLNPVYSEFYVVITNERGRSVHINYSGESAMGRKMLHLIRMQDVTGDQVPEFILQTNSFSSSSTLENRVLEIFSIQSGTLRKVLEERMTLTYDDDLPSPAVFKFVDVQNTSIRVEYVDYLFCEKYKLPYKFEQISQTQERCLEFVTYTYAWDHRTKRFELFYKENRIALKGIVKKDKIFLKSQPSFLSEKIEKLTPNSPFVVILHYEKYFMQNGEKKMVPYLFVESASGKQGYIRGKEVTFLNSDHAGVLRNFYKNPLLSKTEIKSSRRFLNIAGEGVETSAISDH